MVVFSLCLDLNALYNCITIEKQNIAKKTGLLAYIRIEAKTWLLLELD